MKSCHLFSFPRRAWEREDSLRQAGAICTPFVSPCSLSRFLQESISRGILVYGVLALAAAAGSCQRRSTGDLTPVEGTVTKAGCPLCGIEVVFLPDTVGPRASGITDETGHYHLRTDGGEDSAAVGSHRVCIHDTHRVALKVIGRLPKEAG